MKKLLNTELVFIGFYGQWAIRQAAAIFLSAVWQ